MALTYDVLIVKVNSIDMDRSKTLSFSFKNEKEWRGISFPEYEKMKSSTSTTSMSWDYSRALRIGGQKSSIFFSDQYGPLYS